MRGRSSSSAQSVRRARPSASPACAGPGTTLNESTGKSEGAWRSTSSVTSAGRPAWPTRERTSASASRMSVPWRKSRFSSEAPRTVFERTRTRSGTVLIACSIGRVTAASMPRTGASPRCAITAMRAKEICG